MVSPWCRLRSCTMPDITLHAKPAFNMRAMKSEHANRNKWLTTRMQVVVAPGACGFENRSPRGTEAVPRGDRQLLLLFDAVFAGQRFEGVDVLFRQTGIADDLGLGNPVPRQFPGFAVHPTICIVAVGHFHG